MSLMETLLALIVAATLLMVTVPLYVSYMNRNQLLEQKRTELIEKRSALIESRERVEACNDDTR